MRTISPIIFAFSLIAAAVSQAEAGDYRNEAVSIVERIQMKAPPAPLYEEYGNIMETFAKAEELFEQKRPDEAERMFHLTLLKSSLYEEKVLDLKKTPGSSDQSNPASPATGEPAIDPALPALQGGSPPRGRICSEHTGAAG